MKRNTFSPDELRMSLCMHCKQLPVHNSNPQSTYIMALNKFFEALTTWEVICRGADNHLRQNLCENLTTVQGLLIQTLHMSR